MIVPISCSTGSPLRRWSERLRRAARGAILGKAMSALADGQGLVLALINLQ
jgi:hypothetical protein